MNILKKIIDPMTGAFAENPAEVALSKEAEQLLNAAFQGFSSSDPIDSHCHLLGKGTGNTGCYANPEFFTWKHPIERIRMLGFLSGSGVKDVKKADQEYLERLLKLVDDLPHKGKLLLLAMDKTHSEDGTPNEHLTKFYVPNEYVYRVAHERPERFVPAVSVHPYRKDALKELDKWAAKGVKVVKWLPNSMGMNPSHQQCKAFYKKLEENNMILLGHAGGENAISVMKFTKLGNPLLYRPALDAGVKLIMAHCAGMGRGRDLDANVPKPVRNHKLFLRLMAEKQYEGLLFGDLAAVTIVNRMGGPLADLLEHREYHHRMINGTDYPLPALNALVSTKSLVKLGYINKQERNALNEIYYKNPLTFDFALKRTIKHPKNEKKFDAAVFKDNAELKLKEWGGG